MQQGLPSHWPLGLGFGLVGTAGDAGNQANDRKSRVCLGRKVGVRLASPEAILRPAAGKSLRYGGGRRAGERSQTGPLAPPSSAECRLRLRVS